MYQWRRAISPIAPHAEFLNNNLSGWSHWGINKQTKKKETKPCAEADLNVHNFWISEHIHAFKKNAIYVLWEEEHNDLQLCMEYTTIDTKCKKLLSDYVQAVFLLFQISKL